MYRNANRYCIPIVFDIDVQRPSSNGNQGPSGCGGWKDPMSGMPEADSDEDDDALGWGGSEELAKFRFGWQNEKDQNPFYGSRLISNMTTRSATADTSANSSNNDYINFKIYKKKLLYERVSSEENWNDRNDLFGTIGVETKAWKSLTGNQHDFQQYESIKRIDEPTLRKLVIVISHCSPEKMTEALKRVEKYAEKTNNQPLFYSVLMTTLQLQRSYTKQSFKPNAVQQHPQSLMNSSRIIS